MLVNSSPCQLLLSVVIDGVIEVVVLLCTTATLTGTLHYLISIHYCYSESLEPCTDDTVRIGGGDNLLSFISSLYELLLLYLICIFPHCPNQ